MRYVNAYKELPGLLPYATKGYDISTSRPSIEWHWLANCFAKHTTPIEKEDIGAALRSHILDVKMNVKVTKHIYCSKCTSHLKQNFNVDLTEDSIDWTVYQTVFRLESDANKLIKKINSKTAPPSTQESWAELSQLKFIATMLDTLDAENGKKEFNHWPLKVEARLINSLHKKFPWEISEEQYGFSVDHLGIGLDVPLSAAAGRWIDLYNIPENTRHTLQRFILAPYEVLAKESHDDLIKVDIAIVNESFVQAFMSLNYTLTLADRFELASLIIKKERI